jgi:hypothetical protein
MNGTLYPGMAERSVLACKMETALWGDDVRVQWGQLARVQHGISATGIGVILPHLGRTYLKLAAYLRVNL